jgi:uncharacterized protein
VPGYLLDANVLIALAWPAHTAHERARRWFSHHARAGWATCPITQAALVRVLSNPAFSSEALTSTDAIKVLQRNVELPGHQFWSDSITLHEAVSRLPAAMVGHRQLTDAYLVGLALHNRGKLATLDRGIVQLAPTGSVELIS